MTSHDFIELLGFAMGFPQIKIKSKNQPILWLKFTSF
jgi:hypothetical protein